MQNLTGNINTRNTDTTGQAKAHRACRRPIPKFNC